MFCLNQFRSQWRTLINSVAVDMLTPVIIQPLFILFINLVIPNNVTLMIVAISVVLALMIYLAKHDLRSHLLYYWIVSSITYTIIVFEFSIVPLSEIDPCENFILILFSVLSIFFLFLTKARSNKFVYNGDLMKGINGKSILNGDDSFSNCPVCKVKMRARNYHCHICQECIPKYDHHSYWLNCCIGEHNFHLYFAGIFFGVFALAYVSLLILTTICSPDFKFGILLPQDCTDVGVNIEMCTCLVCGIYTMELAFILLIKVVHQSWLISRGFTTFEWQENFKYNIFNISPYSYGFKKNWISFFSNFKKI